MNEKRRVVVTLTKDVAEQLDLIAKKMGLTKSGLITVWTNENRKESEQKNKQKLVFLKRVEFLLLVFLLR